MVLIEVPAHHDPGGGFRNIWSSATEKRFGAFLRWRLQRLRQRLPATPASSAFPRQPPRLSAQLQANAIAVTWVGHSTFLIQLPGINLLTDPVWSLRASPFQWLG